jgi:hypothetical protein
MLASVGEHVLQHLSQEREEDMAANGRSHATGRGMKRQSPLCGPFYAESRKRSAHRTVDDSNQPKLSGGTGDGCTAGWTALRRTDLRGNRNSHAFSAFIGKVAVVE